MIYGNIQLHKFLLLIQYWHKRTISSWILLDYKYIIATIAIIFYRIELLKNIFLRNWIIQNIQVIKNVGKCISFMRQIMMLKRFYFELFMSQFRHSCYQSTSMLYLTHIKTCFPVLFGIEVLRFHVYKKTIFDTMCPNLFVFRIN